MSESRKDQVSPMKGKKHTEETKRKLSLANKGKRPHNYIEDRSKLKKSEKKHLDGRYKDWMLSVKKIDNWKCKISNNDCKGRLEAHHILNWMDFPKLRYDVNNGITLCKYHHPRKRMDEKRLVDYFKSLII
jgi:hypothetical protein